MARSIVETINYPIKRERKEKASWKMTKISYYDLLGMLKENKHPLEIRLYLCDKSVIYFYSNDDGCYIIKNRKDMDINFEIYLRECLTDIQCFENIIEIVETKK